jgi:alkylated DNA repair dioxygenase AlkB
VWTRLTSRTVSHVNITIHAIDKEGQTIEFLLSAKRDISAAKRFFKKMMRAEHALVIEYGSGAGIGWHRDKAVFGEVVGISLLSPCVFRMRRKEGERK